MGRAFAGLDVKVTVEDCMKKIELVQGNKSGKRVLLSLAVINALPFLYFAITFQLIGVLLDDIQVADSATGLEQAIANALPVFDVGILSLSVFAFYRFFMGCLVMKCNGEPCFYTESEWEEHQRERGIYGCWQVHFLAGLLYLLIPWLNLFSRPAALTFVIAVIVAVALKRRTTEPEPSIERPR